MMTRKVNHPVNLLETEVGEEVRDLLSHSSLQLTSGHQAWLLMAILYLVERERRKAINQKRGGDGFCRVAGADRLETELVACGPVD